ncbi:MAG: hypothetical protein ACOYNL_07130 [Rickettsiales bacterium]
MASELGAGDLGTLVGFAQVADGLFRAAVLEFLSGGDEFHKVLAQEGDGAAKGLAVEDAAVF